MCGIVGFISPVEQNEVLESMLEVQAYRGPDDRGMFFDKTSGVHLGHNRLSIQDLSLHGHQPMQSACGDYTIVYNGEVYNFHEIKDELLELGYTFVSKSDTEVILYSYKEWGLKCIDKFIGMFAFAILDKLKEEIILIRDRAGVKPLYYFKTETQFMFSSEIKSFHQHPKFEKCENVEVLPYFFQFGYIPAPYSIFQNCFKLEAGSYLVYNLNSNELQIQKYWDVNDFYQKEQLTLSEDELLDELEDILDNAINLRMVSDVPVGVFLSGGYDSSAVAAILAGKQKRKIKTFTIGFDDPRYNEAQHAKTIAEYLQTDHTEYYMQNSDMLDLVESLPHYYDEPFGDSSALPTMIVSKIAKQNVTVALSADGGDEAFCGYSKYFFLNHFQSIFSSKFKKEFLKMGINLFNPKVIDSINESLPKNFKQRNVKDKFEKFKRAINAGSLEEMFENASSYVYKKDITKFLNIKRDETHFSKWNKIGNVDFLNQMMAIDYKLFMNDDVLTKVDRATMSVSLEGREPLLDHRIIEYLARIPLDIKYKNRSGKYLLRKILYKYLPKELVDKPKAGFQIPLNEWLRGELKPLVLKYLDENRLDTAIFDKEEINRLKNVFFEGENIGTTIWFILMYQMWKEKWVE